MDRRGKTTATGAPVRRSRRRGAQEAIDTPEEPTELLEEGDRGEETKGEVVAAPAQAEKSHDKGQVESVQAEESHDKGQVDSVQAEESHDKGQVDSVQAEKSHDKGQVDSVQAEKSHDKGQVDSVQAEESHDKGQVDSVQAEKSHDKGQVDSVQAEESHDKGQVDSVQAEESHDKGQVDSVQAEENQGPQEQKTGGESKPNLKRKREAPAQTQPLIPQGKPKSGRVWKENKKRFSNMVKDRVLRTSWEVKMKQRQEKMLMKSLAQQLKDDKQQEKEEKKRRREENLKRRLENERRAEVVQVIRNPAKLKRARKKQLRNIEKRDTLTMSQAGKKQKTPPSKGKEKEAMSR